MTSGLLLFGWLLLCENSKASSNMITIRYVAADGDCKGNSPCYSQLQAAIDAANNSDELHVSAGVYTGVNNRNGTDQLVYLDKSITLRGGYHPNTWVYDPAINYTILNAQGLGRVMFIAGNISPTVESFHMINGSGGNGGAVYIDTAAVTIRNNEIYNNWAEGKGGGIYLLNSAAAIVGNHIYTNTTGVAGRGGGLSLSNSPASLDENIIENNSAHVGGGIEIINYTGDGGAQLTNNIIRNNVALDYIDGSTTFNGAGGGIDSHSYLIDTFKFNTISGNSSTWGGGLHAFGASVIIANNTFQENNALYHGGGLYIQGGQTVIVENNDIFSNTTGSWGGGLCFFHSSNAPVRGNTFQGNISNWRGGGMYASSNGHFDGNIFLGNSAVEQGGGAFLIQNNGAVYQNSVFVGNHAKEGGGLYIWAGNPILIHSTIAENTSDDNRAVVIDKYPGLVDPGASTHTPATVIFTNTIVAGQSVGFYASAENYLTVDGILWHETPTHFQTEGVNLTLLNERTGDPVFQADGYHLHQISAARDVAVSNLDHDVDGHLREDGNQKDLGADEFVPTMLIDPVIGGTLTYTNPQEQVTITVDIPADAISEAIGLMFSPFPPLPPDVMNTPFGQFIAIGPPFRLDPFTLDTSVPVTNTFDPPLDDPSEPLIFGFPAHIALEMGLEKAQQFRESMDRLELALLSILDSEIFNPPQDAACGLVSRDPEAGTIDVPICDSGYVTRGLPPFPPPPLPVFQISLNTTQCDGCLLSNPLSTASGHPVRLLAVDPDSETGYFVFMIEVEGTKTFLPVIIR